MIVNASSIVQPVIQIRKGIMINANVNVKIIIVEILEQVFIRIASI